MHSDAELCSDLNLNAASVSWLTNLAGCLFLFNLQWLSHPGSDPGATCQALDWFPWRCRLQIPGTCFAFNKVSEELLPVVENAALRSFFPPFSPPYDHRISILELNNYTSSYVVKSDVARADLFNFHLLCCICTFLPLSLSHGKHALFSSKSKQQNFL